MKLYLAGPIHNVDDPIAWRYDVYWWLPKPWITVNPLHLKNKESDIVKTDLAAIKKCDAVLALVDEPSWGTAMEIYYAFENKIPVIGWHPENKSPLSPWLTHYCHHIVIKFSQILPLLKSIEQGG